MVTLNPKTLNLGARRSPNQVHVDHEGEGTPEVRSGDSRGEHGGAGQ